MYKQGRGSAHHAQMCNRLEAAQPCCHANTCRAMKRGRVEVDCVAAGIADDGECECECE